ncbi:MAG: UDP-2,3-diacylglucosamine pyrophosphatase LpxH [Myxococcota bacterium]
MSIFSWARPEPIHITHSIPADQQIYLISDLHLGDGTRSDIFLGKDRELLAFLDKVREEGAHLVIAGDIVDFHQAWAFERVLSAHAEVLGAMTRLADESGVTYIWGNHDHDISLFRGFFHFEICSTLHIGDDIRVSHGYDYDPHIGANLAQTHTATRVHHLLERLLDTWIRLPLENFYTFENRLAFWLFHKFALVAYGQEKLLGAVGLGRLAGGGRDFIQYWAMNQIGDPACIFENVRRRLHDGPHHTIVTGHSHLPGCVEVEPGRVYVNTGSWTFGSAQYARWDGDRFSVQDWVSGKEYTDQAYRPLLERRYHHMDFLSWWRENYMGWLRFRVGEEGRLPTVIRPPKQSS